jgi:hypothetical protein
MGNTQYAQLRSDQQSEVKMKNQTIFEPEEVPPLTIAQMDSLLEFLPIFTAEEFRVGRRRGRPGTAGRQYWRLSTLEIPQGRGSFRGDDV